MISIDEKDSKSFENKTLITLCFVLSLYLVFELFFNSVNKVRAQHYYDYENQSCVIEDAMHPNYEYEIEPYKTPLHLALARVFISEGGYHGTADYVPIYRVLKNRSQRGRELQLVNIMRYSPYSFRYHSDHFARYIPFLNEQATEPMYWKERYPDTPWSQYRDKWIRALEYAWNLVNGVEFPHSCAGRVDHWGADRPDMIAKALSNGLVRVSCRQRTRNAFWRIP